MCAGAGTHAAVLWWMPAWGTSGGDVCLLDTRMASGAAKQTDASSGCHQSKGARYLFTG